MKIRPETPDLYHADGRTDTTEFIVAFRYLWTLPIPIQFQPHSEQNQPVNTTYQITAVYSKYNKNTKTRYVSRIRSF